ncbi:MAG: putative cytochrome c family protein [Acidobacteria bacterium]|nr:putative cytochrome c family protein [Acidobacteriota bacterium]
MVAGKSIRSAGAAKLVLWWIVAGVWNGFMLILIAFFWGDPGEEDVVKIVSLFELVGLGILVWIVRQTWAWLRYGGSVLELASTPGVIGGKLEGQIQTGIHTFPAKPVRLVLTCLRRRRVKRRKESDTTTDVLWQADRTVGTSRFIRGQHGLTIPLSIAIPYGLPGTDSSNPDDEIHWQLALSSDLPGVDFRAEFLVPVTVTVESRSDWTKEKVGGMADQERRADSPPDSSHDESRVSPIHIHGPTASITPGLSMEISIDLRKLRSFTPSRRMNTYPHFMSDVVWPATGAMMRRLDDDKAAGGKPGNIYVFRGGTDTERAVNLKRIKDWLGDGAWNLNRWKASGDVPGITKEQLGKIRAIC